MNILKMNCYWAKGKLALFICKVHAFLLAEINGQLSSKVKISNPSRWLYVYKISKITNSVCIYTLDIGFK